LGNLDEASERIGMHFSHQVATVHLHGRFANAQLPGDLFVETTADDQAHYFLFARTERFVPLAQFRRLGPLFTGRTVSIDGLLDSVQEILISEWFGEKLHRPGFHGAYRHLNVAVARDKYNWNLDIRVRELMLQLQSAHAGKPHV
jgi:hypothetical protein